MKTDLFQSCGHCWVFQICWHIECMIGEGNGNPLQCSCLENPRDRGAWWAAVYGVAQSRTRLKWLSSSRSIAHWLCIFYLVNIEFLILIILKAQHLENEDHGIWSHHLWEIDEETVETMSDFIFGGSKITADGDCSHEIKKRLLLGRKIMTNLYSIGEGNGTLLQHSCPENPMDGGAW